MSNPDLDRLLERARRAEPRGGTKERLRGRILGAAASVAASSAATAVASHAAAAGSGAAASAGAAAGTTVAASVGAAATASVAGSSLFSTVLSGLALGAALGGLVLVPAVTLAPKVATQSSLGSAQALPLLSARTVGPAELPHAIANDIDSAAPVEPKPSTALRSRRMLDARTAPLAVPAAPTVQLPSIERETELLTEAQRALQRGDTSSALTWLDRHDTEFPRGGLAEEALAARAVATCTLGQVELSQRIVAHFRRRYASSPLLPRVSSACGKLLEP